MPRCSGHSPDISARITAALLAACVATLVVSGARALLFTTGTPLGDDNSSHLAEVARVATLLREGRSDFWFDQTNLGYPLFIAYQPLPTLLMGLLGAFARDFAGIVLLFKASLVLLWGAMPLAWYCGGRWLGLLRLEALCLGLLSVCVSDWNNFGLGLGSFAAKGLYTQAYGMLLLPLAVGASFRYLFAGEDLRRVVLLVSAIVLSHLFFGLYLVLALLTMVIVKREGLLGRARSVGLVLALVAGLTAFWWLPFVANAAYQGGFPFSGESREGLPLARVVSWMLGGRFFDENRFPWLTLALLVGLAGCWRARNDVLPRWILLFGAAAFALFLGRTNWGWLYQLVPFHRDLEVTRYLAAIQYAGLVIAVFGVMRVFERGEVALERSANVLARVLRGVSARTLAFVLLGLLGFATLSARALATRTAFRSFEAGQGAFARLTRVLEREPRGRFLVHGKLGTASHVHRNLLPLLARRPQLQSYARGYHDTASLYFLEHFDFSATAYRLYNVRMLVTRGPVPPAPPGYFKQTFANQSYKVLEVTEPFGYFDFVRVPFRIDGDPKLAREAVRTLAGLYDVGVLPRLSVRSAGPLRLRVPGLQPDALPATDAPRVARWLRERYRAKVVSSRVLEEASGTDTYLARVDARRGEHLVLKASFHPYWQARVDGRRVPITHLAPNFVGVEVAPGRHTVELRYRNPLYQKLLFALSLIALLGWSVVRRCRNNVSCLTRSSKSALAG